MFNATRHALRFLCRRPGFTTAAVATLAVGIGASTAVYSIYNAVLLRPLPFPHPERIVSVQVRPRTGGSYGISGGTVSAVHSLPAVDRIAIAIGAEQTILDGGEPELVRGSFVSDEFFDVLGVSPILGHSFDAGNSKAGEPVVVLSHGLWQRRFGGDRNVVGRAIRVGNSVHTIVGVMPESFRYPEDSEFWALYVITGSELARVGIGPFEGLARLKDSNADAATRQAAAIDISNGPDNEEGSGVVFVPLIESIAGLYRANLDMLLGAVTLVLLISCLNVANLLAGQAATRLQELAIRRAIGATYWHVMRQLIAESAILAGGGAATGIVLAQALVVSLPWLGAPDIPRLHEARIDWQVLAFVVIAASASVCVFGVGPAWLVSRRETPALHAAPVLAGPPRQTASHLLIGTQIAGTLALLVGSALTLTSLYRLHSVDFGFETTHVSVTAIRPSAAVLKRIGGIAFHARVLERLREHPDVESVGMMSHVPLDRALAPSATVTVGPEQTFRGGRDGPRMRVVSPETFRTLGVDIVRGRDFSNADTEDAPAVAMVNQALAQKAWGSRDPIGERLLVERGGSTRSYEVVGLVRDFRPSARRVAQMEVYVSSTQEASRLQLVVRSGLPPAALTLQIRGVLRAEDPEAPMTELTTVSQLISKGNAYTRFHAALITVFGVFAALLASSGILGVVASAVARRRREIGIRIAIGAAPRQAVTLVLREMTFPLVLGLGGGLILVYNLAYVLQRQGVLFEVQQFDPRVYGAMTIALASLALIAAWLPARSAARIDPIAALRCP